jgi:threonine/homoserine/homoserine lactone efflux protein
MHRPRPAASALVTTSMILAAAHDQFAVLVLAGIFVLLYLGLVLPAVWSANERRRRDARAVLQQFFDLVHQPRSP